MPPRDPERDDAQDTFAFAERYDPDSDRYPGLATGRHVDVGLSKDAVLIRPERAMVQLDADSVETDEHVPADVEEASAQPGVMKPTGKGLPRRFYGRVELDPVRAIRDLESILENIVNHLANADGGDVTLTLEVQASSEGFDERVQRTVRENAAQLGFDDRPEFED